MSYAFRVTIRGVVYTEADFVGMSYVQGVPETLNALGEAALDGNSTTSQTSFTPASFGSRTVVLDEDRIRFPVRSVVALRCAGSCLQIGEVTSWDPSSKELTFLCKFHQVPGSPTPPWRVFPATGPAGLHSAWSTSGAWGPRPRTIDEGGYGGTNGLAQWYDMPHGYRSEGAGVCPPRDSKIRNYARGGWIVDRSASHTGPSDRGLKIVPGQHFTAIRRTPLRTQGRGTVYLSWCNYMGSPVIGTVEMALTTSDGGHSIGLRVSQNGYPRTYSVFYSTGEGTRVQPVDIQSEEGYLMFVMGGYGDGRIKVYAGALPFPSPDMSPLMTIGVPDNLISLRVRSYNVLQAPPLSTFQIPYYSITEPLRMR